MTAARKRAGLGRGLDALLGDLPAGDLPAGERAPETKSAGPRTLPVAFLRPSADQPRRIFSEEAIAELAHSIRARGVLQPILVRPLGGDAYEIVAGERRWRAAQKAQLHDVPVIIRELTDEEAAEIALIENVQRVDLNPVEEARAYQRLVETFKRPVEDVARAVGKSRSHVVNTLRLLSLPEIGVKALMAGEITAGHARAALTAPRPQLVVYAVIQDGLSVRAAEALAKQLAAADRGGGSGERTAPAAPKPSVGGKKDADTRALEADLAAALGLEVAIEHGAKGAGALTVRYLSLDQLDDVCRRLMGSRI